MISTIQVTDGHTSGDIAMHAVKLAHDAGDEIGPFVAVTVASWWQSPGGVGRELAAFASGAVVTREALLDDIHATRVHEGYHDGRMDESDRLALDMLATFVLRHA